MNTFQRDLDAAAERARRFFADARAAERRPGDLASAALSLSEVLVSLAFRSERSSKNDANVAADAETPRRAAFPRLFAPADERPRLRVVAAD